VLSRVLILVLVCYFLRVSTQVLVTGAEGHLGYSLVQNLIEHGYRVRAGVRRVCDARRTGPLERLGAEIVQVDMARPDMLAPAMEGVRGVFQSAALSSSHWTRDPEREIVTPTVEGTLNVLAAARDAGVKRIVFTSTAAAVSARRRHREDTSENDWNDASPNPYVRAKTEAEKRAWLFTRANEMEMVAINPSVLLGPGFHRHTHSTATFERILREELPVLPPFDAYYVDVRDAAELHRLAFENHDANGRYIASSTFAPIEQLARIIRAIEPTIRVPSRRIPKWMTKPFALLDAMKARLRGAKRQLSEEAVEEFDGADVRCSSERATRDLGWEPRPLEDTVADTLAWIKGTFLAPRA